MGFLFSLCRVFKKYLRLDSILFDISHDLPRLFFSPIMKLGTPIPFPKKLTAKNALGLKHFNDLDILKL